MTAPEQALTVRDLVKHYQVRVGFREKRTVKAVNGISFSLNKGETLAIVGESGCGKSTLGRLLIRLEESDQGSMNLFGQEISQVALGDYRHQVQMIFQDPFGSLNPRKKAWQIISEPLQIAEKLPRSEYRARAEAVMEKVGLRPELSDRYPHMFSGGQRQRIGIARALIMQPRILVCDEPVSALDVSVQAQVLNLLMDLQDEFAFSYIFISHDLSVVRHIANRIAVIYLGRIVELGDRDQIFERPMHPYTQLLLGSTPKVESLAKKENGQVSDQKDLELPSAISPPQGCPFHTRCPVAQERCKKEVPALEEKQGRSVACFEVSR